jgi:uncharacterized protein
MRLYEGSISQFREDVIHTRIADKLAGRFKEYYHRSAGRSEVGAWQQSFNFLKNSFEVAGLNDNQIIIEYELPYSSRRIDAVLFGQSQKGEDGVVLIELKQWSNDGVADAEAEGNVKVRFASGVREVAHPSWQVEGYHFDLQDFLHVFQDKPAPELSSCAYCHNYARLKEPRTLFAEKFHKGLNRFPVFAKEDVEALGGYLHQRLAGGAGIDVFNRFIRSTVRPSKKLLDHTGDMINDRQIFTLIDDQIAAHNAIMYRAKDLARSQRKSVVIVKGGPGTGKSVIALEVMGGLLRQGRTVMHATGSSAFTNTLRKIVGARAKTLFKFFNSFIGAPSNSFDVLIADEAHRIRETSNNMYTKCDKKSRMPQIDELLNVARLCVFFIDEKQIVRPNEVGSIELIRNGATKAGVAEEDLSEFELQTQFRCSGSDAYLQWLDNTLGIRPSEFPRFDPRMEFRIFDDPGSMMAEVRARNREKKNSARIAAGFCWKWSKPKADGSLVNDVVIGDFQMPWEKKDAFWKWATDDSGMEQVGTVYTAQGFEFDYMAVIFGGDFIYEPPTGKWKPVPEVSHDTQVKRNNPRLNEHLASVYRVLLSRAHKGVYVHFIDKSTEAYFKSQLTCPTPFRQGGEEFVAAPPTGAEGAAQQRATQSLEVISLDDARAKRGAFKTHLPVYSLKAAAGYFGAAQEVEPEGWIDASSIGRLDKDMFVARAVGRSMQPIIQDGDLCVFRANPPGSRQGKIVLVQYRGPADPETGGAFTVKRYRSEKSESSEGVWQHERIVLEPLNSDFQPILLTREAEGDVQVVAELAAVLR